MKKVKIISLLLAILLSISFSVYAVDSFNLTLSPSSIQVKQGETVEVPIIFDNLTVAEQGLGLGAYSATISYDKSILELDSITSDKWEITPNENQFTSVTKDGLVITKTETIATIKFKVKEDAKIGNTIIKLENVKGAIATNDSTPTTFSGTVKDATLNIISKSSTDNTNNTINNNTTDNNTTNNSITDNNTTNNNITDNNTTNNNTTDNNTTNNTVDNNTTSPINNTTNSSISENTANDTSTTTISKNNTIDNTLANKEMPKTGIQRIVLVLVIIGIALVMSCVYYKKYNE